MHMHPTLLPVFCAGPVSAEGPHGDLIIRSSDNVAFRVTKRILSRGSTIFNDMFSIPSPLLHPLSPAHIAEEACTISVTECSDMVAKFLKSITSGPSAVTFRCMGDIQDFYCMGDKYVSDCAMESAKAALVIRAESAPLEVYMMTCRLGLETEARIAARRSLRYSLLSLKKSSRDHTDAMLAPALERLWVYHEACRMAANKVADCEYWAVHDLKLYPLMFFDPRIPPPPSAFSTQPRCCTVAQEGTDVQSYYVKSWFLPFLARISALLASKPSGEDLGFKEWSALFSDAVSQAKGCSRCGPCAFDLLRSYSKTALARVESLVNEIQLEYREI